MATKTIPELNEVTSIDENTLFPIDTGTQTFKLTAANLAEYIAATIIPVGTTVPYAGTSAPSGWLLANGSEVSRSTYSRLFAVIGETFGAGNGSTTFNLPDLRGRVTAGRDNMGGSAASRLTSGGSGINGETLGASGGSQTQAASGNIGGSQSVAHTHTIAHTHSMAHTHNFAHTHQWARWQGGTAGSGRSLYAYNSTSPSVTGWTTSGTNIIKSFTFDASSAGSGLSAVLDDGNNRTYYTGGPISAPSGTGSDATTGGSSAANTGGSSAASSGAMSANGTVSGSNFSFTGTQSNVTQPTIVLNQIIKV